MKLKTLGASGPGTPEARRHCWLQGAGWMLPSCITTKKQAAQLKQGLADRTAKTAVSAGI